nr:30S ribosomal protein S16-2, chloroplastic/mitochondrial [Tanacetum cinerariifolium]
MYPEQQQAFPGRSSNEAAMPKPLVICRYWLSIGAQPSDPVQRLLFRAGLLPPPPMVVMGRKGGPRDTRPVDPCSGRVLMPEEPAKATT